MLRRLIPLLILYPLTVSLTTASHKMLLPDISGCPFTSDILDFCNSEYNSCINEKLTFSFCSAQFCDCSKTALPPSEEKCEGYIADTCRHLKNQRHEDNSFQIDWFVLPDEIKQNVADIENVCNFKILDSSESTVKSLHQTLKNNCSEKHITKLHNALFSMDKNTSTSLPIPFKRFRCGWQYGYIGKVLFRYWMNNACGLYAVDVNHCCAEHFNCYIDQKGKQVCDEKLDDCKNSVVTKMTSYKQSCQVLIKNVSHNLSVEDEVYKSFEKTKLNTKISTFNGNLNEALTTSDVSNRNFSFVEVFKLSSDSSVDSAIREIFYRKVYKYGWSKRIIIDSCALIFEECRQHNKLFLCLKKLTFCLYDIEGKTMDFETNIHEFNRTISSIFENTLTERKIQEMITASLIWIEIVLSLEFVIQLCLIVYKAVRFLLKKLRSKPVFPPGSSQNIGSSPNVAEDNGPNASLLGSNTFVEESSRRSINGSVMFQANNGTVQLH